MPKNISISPNSVEMCALRMCDKSDRNINKVNTGTYLCFDIKTASLPNKDKDTARLLKNEVITIKANIFCTQEKNRLDAFKRLNFFLESAFKVVKIRKLVKVSRVTIAKLIEQESQCLKINQTRKKVRL